MEVNVADGTTAESRFMQVSPTTQRKRENGIAPRMYGLARLVLKRRRGSQCHI